MSRYKYEVELAIVRCINAAAVNVIFYDILLIAPYNNSVYNDCTCTLLMIGLLTLRKEVQV